MHFSIILVLLQAGCPVVAPDVEPAGNKGLWQTKDCKWKEVECPTKADFYSPINTVRLPAFCSVYYPKIAYPVSVDAKVRSDLSSASVLLPKLRTELSRCRDKADKDGSKLADSLATVNDELKDCIDLSKLQSYTVSELQSQVLWTRVFAVVGIAATTLLGVYVF